MNREEGRATQVWGANDHQYLLLKSITILICYWSESWSGDLVSCARVQLEATPYCRHRTPYWWRGAENQHPASMVRHARLALMDGRSTGAIG